MRRWAAAFRLSGELVVRHRPVKFRAGGTPSSVRQRSRRRLENAGGFSRLRDGVMGTNDSPDLEQEHQKDAIFRGLYTCKSVRVLIGDFGVFDFPFSNSRMVGWYAAKSG